MQKNAKSCELGTASITNFLIKKYRNSLISKNIFISKKFLAVKI